MKNVIQNITLHSVQNCYLYDLFQKNKLWIYLLLLDIFQINLLTTVMSDVPVLPDEDDEDALPMLMDSPQCVAFGIFVIW